MNRSAPFTQASLRRAIEAARKAGMHVIGIKPDGTIILDDRKTADNSRDAIELEGEIVL